jgi:serine protease Do
MNLVRHIPQASDGATAASVSRPSPLRAFAVLRVASLLAAAATMVVLTLQAHASPPPDSFADLAQKVTPAVVNISSTHKVAGAQQEMPDMPFSFPPGSPFEDFFKHFREQQQGHQGAPRKMTALGSGFIVDPSGYVVTNNHVIDSATDIKVTLASGKEYDAKLIGTDTKTDLALLKIQASEPLPSVSFGNSDNIRVGDWVMAVGNPFGLGGSVTAGILSARGRDIHEGPFDDFLQIDASINQGNSGGPTFSMSGEVIGINTAIASPNGGSVGIGFAIPSNMAKPVIEALREHGSIERGWIGVQIQEVTPEIASAIGLDTPTGALVAGVQPQSPAAKAGLHQGDVIVGFGGKPINELRDLPRLVADTPVGQKASVEIQRNGSRQTVSIEVAKLQEDQSVASNNSDEDSGAPTAEEGETAAALGVTLARITPDVRQTFNIPDNVHGVAIVDVDADGPAAEQGLRPGDVIEQVAQKAVTSPNEVKALTQAAHEEHHDAVLLLVNRQGNELYIAVKFA